MKIVSIITFLLFSFSYGLCQNKDFIVTNTGDSIYGKIQLKNSYFIIANSTGPQTMYADNVKKIYGVNFKGHTVVHCNLHLYNDNLTDLQMGYAPIKEKDTVMILKEIYSTEKINLYFGTDNLKTQYYFYSTPAEPVPVQLVVRYYLSGGLTSYAQSPAESRGDKSRMHIEVDKGFVNQLKRVMADCETIPEVIWDLLTYRDYSLKDLIKRYNSCY